jgi:hypothetical protein
MSSSRERASGKRRVAYVIGYGAGIGVCELLVLSVYLLGWGSVERGFSPIMNLISSLFLSLLSTVGAMIIGRQLSKKLQERWQVNL